ncbi:MAG: hemolysin-type calcium-binding region, partial [Deltaproteobacteria bacterium]|nr:hemolysin-type calcium-binding region [Deltaproteobacteria bacterium]
SGNGNYSGASLTLVRNGGANSDDVYSETGTLSALTESGNLVVGATTIGTVTTNSGGTLVLTFNSSATTALVNSALQQIAYSNSSDDPSASAQIDWSFDDGNSGTSQGTGGALQATGSTTVSITAVNDEPTLTATGSDPTFTEGGGAVGLFSGTAVSTVESGQTITGLTFTVTNVTDTGNEQITIDGATITLDDLESGSTTDFSYSVSVSGTTATVTLSGGTASTANVVSDIDNATYINNSQDPTDANRVVTFTQIVDSGGTANSGDDTGTPVATSTVDVDAVNDEPTLTAT